MESVRRESERNRGRERRKGCLIAATERIVGGDGEDGNAMKVGVLGEEAKGAREGLVGVDGEPGVGLGEI